MQNKQAHTAQRRLYPSRPLIILKKERDGKNEYSRLYNHMYNTDMHTVLRMAGDSAIVV
jgi:hypothetical protein